ncbi:class I SAM-dependent methyltransferase [Actinophytocola gossypii]|uniref:Methyltransferase domain-containing protein n=1 Tax=Actinophytocola gossypii TaxID=2812003 RepID=A0ABT2J1H2_9PSEU|nr:class I SAM-dependent methyltransferase [Actinophytocola gossypii]MCT2581706.1 methyltransferase domain-containing protein [Actinophytocola gossypii]
MIHEHPLAYVLGLEGIALLRSFTGEHDRAFVEARLTEIRRLLDDPALTGAAVDVHRLDTVDGYRLWARTYDDPGNAAFLDEAPLTRLIDPLPAGVALDAACGTGRIAALLADRGHRVIGVDSSPDMLAHARARLSDTDFRLGDLHRLPVADAEVDLVVCTLALTHVPDLAPVFAEFARVLRPGGHLVLSDVHPEGILRGSVPSVRTPTGEPARLPAHRHLVGDYLRAALPAGFAVRGCEEPTSDRPVGARVAELGPWELWPWCLADLVPEAARAAGADVPALLIWHFQRRSAE